MFQVNATEKSVVGSDCTLNAANTLTQKTCLQFLKFEYFVEYLRSSESTQMMLEPSSHGLYIFDANFDYGTTLMDEYEVPRFFADPTLDAWSCVADEERPPYRWFLVGGPRTGSIVHTDPLGTSAWNAVVIGHKLWVMFEPRTPAWVVCGLQSPPENDKIFEQDEMFAGALGPYRWFSSALPRARANAAKYGYQMREFIVGPGEVAYIPGGWWHTVLNLDDTVAVTQNFVPIYHVSAEDGPAVHHAGSLEWAWKQTCEEPVYAQAWYNQLKIKRPELASRLDGLDCTAIPEHQ